VAVTYLFAGIPVADRNSASAWYERLLGRPADLVPNDNEVAWQVAGAGWIYVVGDTERAGSGLLTVLVDDLDRHLSELAARGITAGAIETAPGLFRKAVVSDPDGNTISFAEDLSTHADLPEA